RDLAPAQRLDLFGHHVGADHGVTQVRQAGTGGEPDVAGPDDGDIASHGSPPRSADLIGEPYSCERGGRPVAPVTRRIRRPGGRPGCTPSPRPPGPDPPRGGWRCRSRHRTTPTRRRPRRRPGPWWWWSWWTSWWWWRRP